MLSGCHGFNIDIDFMITYFSSFFVLFLLLLSCNYFLGYFKSFSRQFTKPAVEHLHMSFFSFIRAADCRSANLLNQNLAQVLAMSSLKHITTAFT